MKRLSLIWGALFMLCNCYAQSQALFVKPVPEAICDKAPMPEAMAKKFAQLREERTAKFVTPAQPAQLTVDADIVGLMSTFLTKGEQAYKISKTADSYRFNHPDYRLLNTSHGRELVKNGTGRFNPKKDRISYAVLRNGNEICIINQEHRAADMSEFTFTTQSRTIHMEGNRVQLSVPVLAIAAGQYPLKHKITCEHASSGAKYTFDLQMSWPKQLDLSGELRAFTLSPIQSEASDRLGLLCDLSYKQLTVVELPLFIKADGHDGIDGKKGRYGANGTDEKKYTDSEGNTKVIAGTCAKPGEDGTDGTDGTDGGRFLLCISPELMQTYDLDGLITTIDAGIGGKGGKGGEGGIHGKGSKCKGRAANGKNGKDGKDGKRGDFLYVLSDVNTFYQQILK